MKENNDSLLEKVSSAYSERTSLRAAIQLIPSVGGALDTLMSGVATKIQEKRVKDFINLVTTKLNKYDTLLCGEPTEELYDLSVAIFDGVVKSRSETKREYFASLFANHVAEGKNLGDTEVATKLLIALDDIHIEILKFALKAPTDSMPLIGKQLIAIENKYSRIVGTEAPPYLKSTFPNVEFSVLKLACFQLVSYGLLTDAQAYGHEGQPHELFVVTELARWFRDFIQK